jgi:pSer/pThr/pTyr-binding forkhead associated (FHA) protein
MIFRLRYLQHQLELGVGEFLIGRSPECQLALDDPLVSRRHAALIIAPNSVTVQDLGSRNGVLVNGARIDRPVELDDGDTITIGSQKLSLSAFHPSNPDAFRRRAGSQTLSAMQEVLDAHRTPDGAKQQEVSKRIDALHLLSGLADKALGLGRNDEAERILASVLAEILSAAQLGTAVPTETIDLAGRYAMRLGAATTKAGWIDYVFKLYAAAKRPCPALIVDELYNVLRRIKGIDLPALRAYVELIQELSSSFGPGDKFLVQRIEGLERLAALH